MVIPNTLGGKPRLSYINLVSEPNTINPFSNPKSRLTTHNHTHHQKTIQPPDMPLLKYLPHEICKPTQPNFLPHEICKPEPKPTPAIRVYPASAHEFFIPKPTEKPTTPLKPVTRIRAWLWGLPPDQKKKKNFRFITSLHQIRDRQKRVESPPSKPPIPSTEWRYHTTCRRHAITFAPTMSLHEFWDLTH